jgi:hypothetical protein
MDPLFIAIYRHFVQAQTASNKTSLTAVMTTIEQQFNVKFSYAVEEVVYINIENQLLISTLQETIAYLNSKVLLNFKALDTRYVTVSVLNKTFSVCGIVSTQDSQATLPGATVKLDDSSNRTNPQKNGTFNLNNVALDATITISFIGYQSSQFTANELFSAEKTAGKSS